MAIKFSLIIQGKTIRNLDTLRDNFYAYDILEVYKDNRLINFLKDREHLEEGDKIAVINKELSDFEVIKTIADILSVNVSNIKVSFEKEHKFSHIECNKIINELEEKIEQLEKEKNTIKLPTTTPLLDLIQGSETSKVKDNLTKIYQEAKSNQNKELKDMVYIEGSNFIMGNGWFSDNKPHKVTISNFYIGKYQITQKEYQEIMGNNPSYFKAPKFPVETVSWFDAIKFCNAKSMREGYPIAYNEVSGELLSPDGYIIYDITKVKGYRLPTEAEWEYAARGGNKSKEYIYSGSNNPNEVAWYKDNSLRGTNGVGSKKSNELYIYDLIGNVWEWCSDWYDKNYYITNSSDINPINTDRSNVSKVLRGGSWSEPAQSVAKRFYSKANDNSNCVGFRLVINP